MEFVITGQSHECSESGAQRKVDLFGCLHPDIDVEYFLPLGLQVVPDAKPGAFKKDPANKERNENKVGQ